MSTKHYSLLERLFHGDAINRRMAELEQELQVRTDIMNLTSIVSESDKKGDILSINDKFMEVSKYPRNELVGHPHNTTRHPDMPKETFKQLWATIGRGDIFRGVIKNRAKDGTPYYVDAVVAPFMGPNGKPEKYLGVRYDITDVEIERRNARAILSAIDASYGYVEFDLEGKILTANGILLKLMGYSLDEIKGQHHRIFVEPAFAQTPEYTQFWSDLRAGVAKSDTFKRLNHNRQEVWLQAVYAPVKDETGRVSKVVKIATDVTADVRIKMAINNLPVAVTVSDASGCLVSATPPAVTLLQMFTGDGTSASALIGRKLTSLFHNPQDARQMPSPVRPTRSAPRRKA
jgi:methyl-accepting chemotaxis protein